MLSPFEGDLVVLRAREPEDEPLLYAWFNDPAITQHLSLRYPLSHGQERRYIETTADPSYTNATFGVAVKATGQLIGGVDLRVGAPENRAAELGIAIGDRDHWNGGYGTDTMRTACRFGFEMMNLHRIFLYVYADNARAMHVYEKVGFKHEGRLRDGVYKFGRYQDVFLMSLLEGELQ